MSMKIFSDSIGNRTRDLPVCGAVPQPLRHLVPMIMIIIIINDWAIESGSGSSDLYSEGTNFETRFGYRISWQCGIVTALACRFRVNVNRFTPELNPSAQRCLTRFLLGILLLEPCVSLIDAWKNQQMQQLLIQLINYVWYLLHSHQYINYNCFSDLFKHISAIFKKKQSWLQSNTISNQTTYKSPTQSSIILLICFSVGLRMAKLI
jgi:hypothetical protein